MKRTLSILFLAGLLAGILLFGSACGIIPVEEPILSAPTRKLDSVVYNVIEVKLSPLEVKVELTGSFDVLNKIPISFDVSEGEFNQFYVKPGDIVKKGQLLADLETGDLPDRVKDQKEIYNIAIMQYEKAKADGADEFTLKKASLYAQLEKNTLDTLSAEYNKNCLRSPAAGEVVYLSNTYEGASITHGQVMLCLTSKKEIVLKCANTAMGDHLKKGMDTVITYNGVDYPSTILMMPEDVPDTMADVQGFMIISTEGLPDDLKYGSYAKLTWIVEKRDNVMLIPYSYLLSKGNMFYVKILKNGFPELAEVTTGYSDNNYVEILTGLNVGDQLIVN